jgi:hypothetical protein
MGAFALSLLQASLVTGTVCTRTPLHLSMLDPFVPLFLHLLGPEEGGAGAGAGGRGGGGGASSAGAGSASRWDARGLGPALRACGGGAGRVVDIASIQDCVVHDK